MKISISSGLINRVFYICLLENLCVIFQPMKKSYFFIFVFFIVNQFLLVGFSSKKLYIVDGFVYNEDNNEPIVAAKVLITSMQNKSTDTVQTNSQGKFSLIVDPHHSYKIIAYHRHYFSMPSPIEFQTVQYRKQYSLQIPLKEIFLGKALLVEKINFNVNDTAFTAEANPALEKFYTILANNTQLTVEIAVHTDSRGDDNYNLELSQQRADKIVAYLVGKGITANRLWGKGYGESRLVNHCSNGVRCTSTEHNANRRVEFVIVRLVE
jgi:outer membrane protein OmpA-like peptidoglycan-associated protein